VLMIVFHGAYDLDAFGFIRIDLFGDPFWYGLPRVIVSVFLICVGISLALVHRSGIDWPTVRRRAGVIGGCAAVITGVSLALFPKNFVYFGILHCIAVSGVLGLFFVRRPRWALMAAVCLGLAHRVFLPDWPSLYGWLGTSPMDHVPLVPWFGWVLFGIYLESIGFHALPLENRFPINLLAFLGRHSLLIYMVHRPVLYGTVLALYSFAPPVE